MDRSEPKEGSSSPSISGERVPQCLVVMYHYVHDGDPLSRPDSTAPRSGIRGLRLAEFRDQIDTLSSSMEPMNWPMLAAGMAGRGKLPERSFLLTFDDGLADHARNVLPILEERGLRGVFFIPTMILAGRRMLAAHQVHILLNVLGEAALEREIVTTLDGLGERSWSRKPRGDATPGHDAARAMYHYETAALARLKHFLTMELPLPLRERVLDGLFERHVGSTARWAKHWYVGWDDVVRMQTLGHTVGGHGHVHEPYGRLTAEEVRADVRQAGTVLREGLGPDPRPFSFPYGSYTGAACGACKDAGFIQAFTTQRRSLSRACDPYRLPRIDTIFVNAELAETGVCEATS